MYKTYGLSTFSSIDQALSTTGIIPFSSFGFMNPVLCIPKGDVIARAMLSSYDWPVIFANAIPRRVYSTFEYEDRSFGANIGCRFLIPLSSSKELLKVIF